MIYFLGFLLLLYILWRIFRPIIIRRASERYIRYVNDQARRAFEQQFGQSFCNPFTGPQQSQPQPRRRKIFTREMGEYVEFEELEGTFHSERTSTETIVVESQVTDAEWEDIP